MNDELHTCFCCRKQGLSHAKSRMAFLEIDSENVAMLRYCDDCENVFNAMTNDEKILKHKRTTKALAMEKNK